MIAPGPTLAPLTLSDPVAREELRALLQPFFGAGGLASVDVHVADQLGRLAGERDPEVLLALALAVRAPRHGHICVDLLELGDVDVLPDEPARAGDPDGEEESPRAPMPWPTDRTGWLKSVSESDLVDSEGNADSPRPFVLSSGLLYTRRYWHYQHRLATVLSRRFGEQREVSDPELLKTGLATLFDAAEGIDRQQLGAAMAVQRGFCVISGGPGTGKTYTVRNILTLLWAQTAARKSADPDVPELRVALAAPTGKAAARMKEAIAVDLEGFLVRAKAALPPGCDAEDLGRFLADLQPTTLHRLLRWNPANPTRFRHDESDPVPYDVVVVDEASMVDFALMAKLALGVGPLARLILLGDRHQLASVEAGTVLADLCGPSGVPGLRLSADFAAQLGTTSGIDLTGLVEEGRAGPWDCIVQLDKSRRFTPGSGIGTFAKACLAFGGDPVVAVSVLTDPSRFPDVRLLPHADGQLGAAARAEITAGFRPYLERLFAGPGSGESLVDHHHAVLMAFDGFRVLCAHRKGPLGVAGVNKEVVRLLEAGGLRGFRPRGPFWPGLPLIVRRNDYVVGRFNGDVGVVVKDADGELTVAFPGQSGAVEYLAPSRLPEHQTVFAMTIHKSQGSEFEHAMVVLPSRSSPILTRELIYTGVTRAKKRMTMLGAADLLGESLKRTVRRASGLRAQLWGSET